MKIADIEAALAADKHVDIQPDGKVVISDSPPPEPCELCGKTEHDPGCGLCCKRKRLEFCPVCGGNSFCRSTGLWEERACRCGHAWDRKDRRCPGCKDRYKERADKFQGHLVSATKARRRMRAVVDAARVLRCGRWDDPEAQSALSKALRIFEGQQEGLD